MAGKTSDAVHLQPTLRVVQLDAAELDTDILRSLREQVAKAFQYFGPSFLACFEPELNVALRSALWWFSVNSSGSTFGQSMLSIAYWQGSSAAAASPSSLSARYKLIHFLLIVVAPWLAERSSWLQDIAACASIPASSVRRFIGRCNAVLKVANLVNFIVFLQQGRYQTLVERLLTWQTVFTRHGLNQQIDFDIQNRELLWHTCGEFLLFLAPLVRTDLVIKAVRMLLWPWREDGAFIAPEFLPPQMTGNTRCAVCDLPPTTPHTSDCGHVFCYYCLKANSMADRSFHCPSCSSPASNIVPVTPSSQ